MERDVAVTVVALYAGGPREEDLAGAGVAVRHGGFRRISRRPWEFPGAALRFRQWLWAYQPDVVHAFLHHAYVITAPIARSAGVPVLVAGRRSLGDFKESVRGLAMAEAWTNSLYDAFVANADAVATDSLRRENIDPRRMHVIRNAITADDSVGSEGGSAAKWPRPIVLCVANLKVAKGHSYLLAAQAALAAQGVRFTLILAGDGRDRAALEQQAAELNIDVHFLGQRRDVPHLLSAADVFVLPSVSEGMSNALMEAMVAGCAVVATDVGGNPEVLGDAGVLCRPADPAALAEALQRVLCDDELRSELGQQARIRARQAASVQVMAAQYEQLYTDLLGAQPRYRAMPRRKACAPALLP